MANFRLDPEDIDAIAEALAKKMKPEDKPGEPDVYTFEQAARKLNIGKVTLGRKIKARHMENMVLRIGKERAITRSMFIELQQAS